MRIVIQDKLVSNLMRPLVVCGFVGMPLGPPHPAPLSGLVWSVFHNISSLGSTRTTLK